MNPDWKSFWFSVARAWLNVESWIVRSDHAGKELAVDAALAALMAAIITGALRTLLELF